MVYILLSGKSSLAPVRQCGWKYTGILKLIVNKEDVEMWTGFILLAMRLKD
jgi:hypothetical protein